jgi:hypothetical protein
MVSYGKKRVDEAPPDACGQVPGVRPWQSATTAAHFVPLSIIKPDAGAELEIELTNACMVRLKGLIDPLLLQAAITKERTRIALNEVGLMDSSNPLYNEFF